MTDIIQSAEKAAASFWSKIVAWWNGDAMPTLVADEKAVLAIFEPILKAGEAQTLQDLKVAATGILTQVEVGKYDLAALEALVLNGLQSVGEELYQLAVSMGSQAFQALIGLILAKLAASAVAAAPAAAS